VTVSTLIDEAIGILRDAGQHEAALDLSEKARREVTATAAAAPAATAPRTTAAAPAAPASRTAAPAAPAATDLIPYLTFSKMTVEEVRRLRMDEPERYERSLRALESRGSGDADYLSGYAATLSRTA
jgi:hypothetical protein